MRFKASMILLVALFCSCALAQRRSAPASDNNASDWKEFSSAEGQFTVSLPGTPKTDTNTVDTPIGQLKSRAFVLETDNFLYYVTYVDLPGGPETLEETKEALDASRDRAVAKHRLITEKDITLDGIAGRELLVERGDTGLILKNRFFYAKQRLYQLILTGRRNVVFVHGKPSPNEKDQTDLFQKTSAKFLDSFKLTK